MKSYTFRSIAISSVVTLCGVMAISAQCPPCRARTLDLRATIDPANSTVTGCSAPSTFGTPSSWITGATTPVAASGICYSTASGANFGSWQARVPGDIVCEASLPPSPKQKGSSPQSAQNQDTSCRGKFADAHSYIDSHDYATAYPLFKQYLETCYDSSQGWRGFIEMDYAVQFYSPDLSRFANYRDFIKSILWLNPVDPYWYCTAISSILFTYQWDSTAKGPDNNAAMAVVRYAEKTNHCPMDSGYYARTDSATRASQRQHWLDTCQQFGHDTLKFPLDTTLPSLHSLGLDILMGPQNSVPASGSPNPGMGELTASANPFRKECTITFELGEYAYTSFQLFDLLGRVVQGDFKGSVLSPGEHRFTIDGSQLASGTYYARVTTLSGETRMLKLTRQ